MSGYIGLYSLLWGMMINNRRELARSIQAFLETSIDWKCRQCQYKKLSRKAERVSLRLFRVMFVSMYLLLMPAHWAQVAHPSLWRRTLSTQGANKLCENKERNAA
jgi:hypothetical protein